MLFTGMISGGIGRLFPSSFMYVSSDAVYRFRPNFPFVFSVFGHIGLMTWWVAVRFGFGGIWKGGRGMFVRCI
jgi:hypothetical protein